MVKKTDSPTPSKAPRRPAGNAQQRPGEAWQPRQVRQPMFNVFVSDHRGPDSDPIPMDIRDANEDSAPLEGSHDRSDSDSVSNDYDAARAERRERTTRPQATPTTRSPTTRSPRPAKNPPRR